jgi:hypothetical protein
VTAPDPARAPLAAVARVLRAAGRDAARVAEPAPLKSWARNDERDRALVWPAFSADRL